jgi:elongator complex protein 1
MYKDTTMADGAYRTRAPGSTSKVNLICNAFIAVFEKNKSTRMQNLITAHVCKEPPDLDGGLRIVSRLRGMIHRLLGPSDLTDDGDDAAERAAEHICFLADVNKLYDHALGIYDLDVAMLIAQQSQMVRYFRTATYS